MTARRALVTGASIAGLSTAFWLARAGWDVIVLERAPSFRDGGQNVDVRGTAREVLDTMGLTDAVRARSTTEEGTSFVDDRGREIGRFPVDASDPDGPTAELEILRGDLARVVLDHLPDSVQVRYDDHVVGVEETTGGEVQVRLASGASETLDLLVVAEGVRSATRDLVFGGAVERRELGLNMAYGTIARTEDDDRWWRWYATTGGRQVTLRPDNAGTTRATLAYTSRTENLADLDRPAAAAVLARTFDGAGWQARRVVDGFAASDDVYVDYLTQIKMASWSQGHTCVVGDAAWCVTPLGGGGTSLALTGGYVLAAYLAQAGDGDLTAALRRYEEWMRPVITSSQKLPPGTPDLFYPQSPTGIRVLRLMLRAVSSRPLRRLGASFSHVARTDRQLPTMPRSA